MDYNKIGKFIATIRKKKGLTQKNLANHLNVTDRAVSKWERGKGCPDISLLEELSKILDVSIIELLKGEEIKIKQKEENEELLYYINYTKKYEKDKIRKIINTVTITLVTIIILIIIYNNIKINMLFNHHYYYYSNIEFLGEEDIFKNIEIKIDLIKEENINYSKEKLNNIINIVEANKDIDKKYFYKEYYTFNEIKNIILKDKTNGVNDILKLANNKNDDYRLTYYADNYYDNKKEIIEFINECYKYDYTYNKEEFIGNQIKNLLYDKNYIYTLVLDDIINGGEEDE